MFMNIKVSAYNKRFKFLSLLIVMMYIIFMVSGVVYAADSLGDRIKSELNSTVNGADATAKAAGTAMDNLVKSARQIGILVIIGVILIGGYAFLFAGARKIAEYKVHALIIIVAVIFLFRTEAILVTILKIVGAEDILKQLYGI